MSRREITWGAAITAVLLLSAESQAAKAADSVVIGRAMSNTYIEGVQVECPKDAICMDGWFRWLIRADETIAGPKIGGIIRAAAVQHTDVVSTYQNRLRLFVLEPITAARQRERLHADYYLRDQSLEYPMYCLDQDPGRLGIGAEDVHARSDDNGREWCFELPEH